MGAGASVNRGAAQAKWARIAAGSSSPDPKKTTPRKLARLRSASTSTSSVMCVAMMPMIHGSCERRRRRGH